MPHLDHEGYQTAIEGLAELWRVGGLLAYEERDEEEDVPERPPDDQSRGVPSERLQRGDRRREKERSRKEKEKREREREKEGRQRETHSLEGKGAHRAVIVERGGDLAGECVSRGIWIVGERPSAPASAFTLLYRKLPRTTKAVSTDAHTLTLMRTWKGSDTWVRFDVMAPEGHNYKSCGDLEKEVFSTSDWRKAVGRDTF